MSTNYYAHGPDLPDGGLHIGQHSLGSLRERGYGTIGPWVETDGQGDFGILVVRSDLEHRGSPTTTLWTKRNSSSGRFTS